jgi:hypothetical protein
MKNLPRLFLIGAVTIAAIYVFRFQQGIADKTIAKVKTKDPEQLALAAAMTVGLGLVAVVAAAAFKKI